MMELMKVAAEAAATFDSPPPPAKMWEMLSVTVTLSRLSVPPATRVRLASFRVRFASARPIESTLSVKMRKPDAAATTVFFIPAPSIFIELETRRSPIPSGIVISGTWMSASVVVFASSIAARSVQTSKAAWQSPSPGFRSCWSAVLSTTKVGPDARAGAAAKTSRARSAKRRARDLIRAPRIPVCTLPSGRASLRAGAHRRRTGREEDVDEVEDVVDVPDRVLVDVREARRERTAREEEVDEEEHVGDVHDAVAVHVAAGRALVGTEVGVGPEVLHPSLIRRGRLGREAREVDRGAAREERVRRRGTAVVLEQPEERLGRGEGAGGSGATAA